MQKANPNSRTLSAADMQAQQNTADTAKQLQNNVFAPKLTRYKLADAGGRRLMGLTLCVQANLGRERHTLLISYTFISWTLHMSKSASLGVRERWRL